MYSLTTHEIRFGKVYVVAEECKISATMKMDEAGWFRPYYEILNLSRGRKFRITGNDFEKEHYRLEVGKGEFLIPTEDLERITVRSSRRVSKTPRRG